MKVGMITTGVESTVTTAGWATIIPAQSFAQRSVLVPQSCDDLFSIVQRAE